MHIVHINHNQDLLKPKVKKVSKQEARVDRWIAKQYQKQYNEALLENRSEILEIQKHIPGWLPQKEV